MIKKLFNLDISKATSDVSRDFLQIAKNMKMTYTKSQYIKKYVPVKTIRNKDVLHHVSHKNLLLGNLSLNVARKFEENGVAIINLKNFMTHYLWMAFTYLESESH